MDENKTLDPKLAEALEGIWDSLTDEQKEKAKACETLDELTALAGKEGVELPDELLDAVAGGFVYWNRETKKWEVIRDKDGKVLDNGARNKPDAQGIALFCWRQSKKELTPAELAQLRENPGSIKGC
jgi:hypothetical protein